MSAQEQSSVDAYVDFLVSSAPELTPDQVGRLAALLRPATAAKPKDRAA